MVKDSGKLVAPMLVGVRPSRARRKDRGNRGEGGGDQGGVGADAVFSTQLGVYHGSSLCNSWLFLASCYLASIPCDCLGIYGVGERRQARGEVESAGGSCPGTQLEEQGGGGRHAGPLMAGWWGQRAWQAWTCDVAGRTIQGKSQAEGGRPALREYIKDILHGLIKKEMK